MPPWLLQKSGRNLPADVGELAVMAGLTPDEVAKTLARLDRLEDHPVEISRDAIPNDAVLVDVRHAEERALSPVTGAVCLQEIDLAEKLTAWTRSTLIIIGSDSRHSWSAAMYLRDHGCSRAFTLRDQAP